MSRTRGNPFESREGYGSVWVSPIKGKAFDEARRGWEKSEDAHLWRDPKAFAQVLQSRLHATGKNPATWRVSVVKHERSGTTGIRVELKKEHRLKCGGIEKGELPDLFRKILAERLAIQPALIGARVDAWETPEQRLDFLAWSRVQGEAVARTAKRQKRPHAATAPKKEPESTPMPKVAKKKPAAKSKKAAAPRAPKAKRAVKAKVKSLTAKVTKTMKPKDRKVAEKLVKRANTLRATGKRAPKVHKDERGKFIHKPGPLAEFGKVRVNGSEAALERVHELWTGRAPSKTLHLTIPTAAAKAAGIPSKLVMLGLLTALPAGADSRVWAEHEAPLLCTDEKANRLLILSRKGERLDLDAAGIAYLTSKPKFGDRAPKVYVHKFSRHVQVRMKGQVGEITGGAWRLTPRGIEG